MHVEIGDRNQAGTLEIADTRWNGNGTLFVTVRELYGHRCWGASKKAQDAAVRRFARGVLSRIQKRLGRAA